MEFKIRKEEFLRGLYLAQGIADLVEANGKQIASVLYYPPAYGGGRGVGSGGHGRDRISAWRLMPGSSASRSSIASTCSGKSTFTRFSRLVCTGPYLIAPIVNPRTNCLETMILNMITGRAIMVPVAMICPQGRSYPLIKLVATTGAV